ncbi:unnamed protein product [Allacma fusca]|uniref:Uncharacterized protein n=1 Tax=Allacma fusca TaxID=39272 RepID=A0A8J2K4K4_9HEXA|nr:unnamed protein product [Allacma fusca]
MSSRKLSRGENFLVKKCSRSYREGSVPSSIKRALKSITESPTPKKVTPLHSNRCSMKSPAIESCKNEAKCLPYHLSEPESDDNGSLENSNFEENFKSFHNTLGSFLDKNVTKGMHSKKDKGLLQKLGLVEKHLSNRQHQQQLLSSLKSRRKKSAKIKKKLWWLFDSEYLDSSQGTPSLSSLKSFLPGHEIDCERVQDYFTIREDFSDSSGPDASSQVRQNSSRLSILKYPYGKTSRKRNIKMSYNPPDFSDLFPYAGTILAEASQFMPRMIPNTGRIIAHRKNAAVVSNRLLTPIWPK